MKRWTRAGLLASLFLLAALLAGGGSWVLAASGSQGSQAVESAEGKALQESHQEAGHGSDNQKVWDLIWRTMNFVAVLAVFVILLRKPLSSALRGRRESIKEELESLEASKEKAQAELEETLARLEGIKAEKEKIIEEFTAYGQAEKAKILAEAEEMAARIKEQARLRIEQEVEQARNHLTEEIAELSVAKAMD
ncbi:MAG: ATP synthase F0 subunit B, partial [Deltaproteobacteria bacterium]|nr:ATP synthase F0 subunit B [Deltaproteobacteria bacterium]